jgi:integrase/recombinase XerD
MVGLRLRYVVEDVDRHGNVRCYFRRKGQAKIRLPGLPGSDEFMAAYQSALRGDIKTQRIAGRPAKGSFGCLCLAYYASPTFKALDPSTQAWRRRALDSVCANHADKPVTLMQPHHVRRLRDEKADRPGAARNLLKALRALFRWALENGEAIHDPTRDVQPIRYVSKRRHVWTDEEMAAFVARHPIGTKAYLALCLLRYTGCRREDVPRLGRQHVKNGRLQYTQAKNEHRQPIRIDIPLHPELEAAIAAAPSGHMTFLATEYGKPFTAAGFGNWFRDRCDEAGLPHCSAHGVRHAVATRLADRSASPHEIMSVTGHQSLHEVERYTREAHRARLADSAMEKLK